MPSRNDNQANSQAGPHSWASLIARLFGFCVFLAAFSLPAVRAGASGQDATVLPGWKCASVALTETVALLGKSTTGRPSLAVVLVALSGWINPLVLLLLCCSFFRALLVLRRVLAVLVVLCMAATWTFFALQNVTPLVGHYVWIAGALLILVPAALGGPRRTAGDAIAEQP